ncbi:MAG: hypothetical protein ACI9CD_000807 [Candidatus Deianiraeaceae bacterium]|jgi:hypothetical protein
MFAADCEQNKALLSSFQSSPPTSQEVKNAQKQARDDRERFLKSEQLAKPSADSEAKGTRPLSILKTNDKKTTSAKAVTGGLRALTRNFTGDCKKDAESTFSSFPKKSQRQHKL